MIDAAEMVQKIKAAVDSRRDGDLLIIARTDAIAPEGYEAAIARAEAYREAGHDAADSRCAVIVAERRLSASEALTLADAVRRSIILN